MIQPAIGSSFCRDYRLESEFKITLHEIDLSMAEVMVHSGPGWDGEREGGCSAP